MAHDLNQSFKRGLGPDLHSPYTEVHVLLITWAGNDLHGVDKEVENLQKVFEQDYKYNSVTLFPIPDDGSHRRGLNEKICKFLNDKAPGNLIIVYYAGHCSPDANGQAQWAALEKGGPTLPWNPAQQLLFSAACDVLLILDCCHASLITKGSKDEGSRFELIAASAKGVKTPMPGSKSFTKALTQLLKEHAIEGISSESLTSKLREHAKITETPVFHNFVRTSPTNIRLQRLAEVDRFIQKPKGYLLFRVSLSGNVTGMQIAEWLKSAPPQNVTAVNIEAIVSRACQIQALVDNSVFTNDSMFLRLSKRAREEIKKCLRGLNTTMVETAERAKDAATATDGVDADAIRNSLDQIEESVSNFCTATETPLLLEAGVDKPLIPAQDAADDDNPPPLITAVNLNQALLLRQAILDNGPCAYSIEIGLNTIVAQRRGGSGDRPHQKRFRHGTVDGQPVIMETYKYQEASGHSGDPQEQTLHQVRRVTGLLCHPKRKGFHILPCAGFFRDRRSRELGLVFNLPPCCYLGDGGGVVTLVELYKVHKDVPLGHRIHLASALATAIETFHRVGWVHKSIRSNNIAFAAVPTISQGEETTPLPNDDGNINSSLLGNFDLSNPLLFGFEYSRAGDEATNMEEDYSQANNLYRIPERWGRPTAPFEKGHDVYSLGVVLIEIALWESIGTVLKSHLNKGPVVAAEVAKVLAEKCVKHLPRKVGQVFTSCILTCLDFGSRTRDMSDYEAQRYFQRNITEPIRRAVHKV
ncbi:hypothetical protein EDB81DRAFT_370136 [Dactylonectria macrodidyma]|uniref:Protein kinase domain-containing protein n=1 Tax=Dactylonectria macrodidyma TaxID=307937 RepID=A0A9P9I7G9_9HYPO|nr:hypothetical protein EDB81DRAFT_370136 [Dactylonectria macrodidyma]